MPIQCGACQANLPMDADIVVCPECGKKNRIRTGEPEQGEPADRWADLLPDEPEPEPEPEPRPRSRGRAGPAAAMRRGGLTSRGTRDLLPKKRRGPRAGAGGKGSWILVVIGIVLFVVVGIVVTGVIMSGQAMTGDTEFHQTISLPPKGWKRGTISAGAQWGYTFRVKPQGGSVWISIIRDDRSITPEKLRNLVLGNSIEVHAGTEKELEDCAVPAGEWAWYVMNFSEEQSVTVQIDFSGE